MTAMNPRTLQEIEEYVGPRFESRFGERFERRIRENVIRELHQKTLDNFEFRLSKMEAQIQNLNARLIAAESKTK
jgi:hypothetical protein